VRIRWLTGQSVSAGTARQRPRRIRFIAASTCCAALSVAGLRCNLYEKAPPAGANEWRASAPRAAASAALPSQEPAPSPASTPGGSDGANARDGAREVKAPPASPSYLPASYQASLECAQPRAAHPSAAAASLPQLEEDQDADGTLGTFQVSGPTTTADHAFFQAIGTNGRACVTCHEPASAMSVSVDRIQLRFEQTLGTDPIFAPVDGADCPSAVEPADTSAALVGGSTGHGTAEARASHSLLLTKGLFRVFLPVPEGAEYTVTVERDPAHCNTDPAFSETTDPRTGATRQMLSVYRRPRPTANLSFAGGEGGIMWDGREPSLESQAVDATLVHAQATATPSEAEVAQIVAFERGIFTAQVFSNLAHGLTDFGALGGPRALASWAASSDDAGAGGRPLPLFDAWRSLAKDADRRDQRLAVLRGQTLFESRTFAIASVGGLNDAPALGRTLANGTCATCHGRPGVASSPSSEAQLDIGIGGADSALGGPAPASELPVFKIVCKPGTRTGFHGSTVVTNDPGKALFTGKCADVGRFTIPGLRGLAARAPYFSDGSAPDLAHVVDFYDKRFSIGLLPAEKDDLVQFLRTL